MLEFHKLARTSLGTRVRTVLATVLGFGMTGDDENAETNEDCECIQPLGLCARPVPDEDTEALVYVDGDERVIIGLVHKTSSLHTVEEGAAELYSPKEPTCVMKMRADGKIEVTAKSGQDIVLNAGDKRIARMTDNVNVCTIAATAGPYPAAITITPILADGTPGTPVVGAPGSPVTITAVISSQTGNCAEHALA